MRVSLLLDLVAETLPDRIAIDGPGGSLSFGDLHARARGFAASLEGSTARNVGFLGVNSPALPAVLFGAALADRPFAPLNYRLPDDGLRKLAARLAPAVIVADDDMAARIAGIDGIEVRSTATLAGLAAPEDWYPASEDEDTAVLLFTSGTSGEPKAALLRHENLTSYVVQTVEFLGADEEDATLVSVPPYHIAAVLALLTSVYSGRRVVQLEAFTPEGWVDAAARFAVSHAMLVPTMLARVLDRIEEVGTALPALRALAYGGGRMPLSVIHRALALMPDTGFTNAYGLTETSSTISVLGPDDHALARSGDAAGLARLATVGKPVPGVEVEVRDGNRVCGPNEPGEVFVRGEQVAGRYAERAATDDDGWFATKDRGWFDADGYLTVDGRLDDVIVRGGENISPGEIEDVLRTHPQVADVAVIGAPDEQWGERVVAFAVPRDPAFSDGPALSDWVRARLRSTKAPAQVHFRESLPYNDTGKLLRRLLRDELAD
ncbi:AMP-binding protein [Novosphingobium sp. KCTC 2891]|uniref:class I adenylate-forming enzyme family protein n=1 Tax=Novosphingobium sp. KCTC 2891 TaxID=2989730 RepID=UPI002221AB68|nr:AMP-binding protein [Novosphingobium sp. KCTC 2891]MCW1384685.1 AMP-binding protein [Novosphingobium sp. KCTC 2891]